MKTSPYVVAIAGPIGGGKSALAKAIAQALGDAVTVWYDDYETATRMPAQQLRQWMAAGACFDAFAAPGLAVDLQRLKQGGRITVPATNAAIGPAKYIVFETPLGRQHTETASAIDLLIWVDTPLDIALARKLEQFTGAFLAKAGSNDQSRFVHWLNTYLSDYLQAVGGVLAIQKQRVGTTADIILDGLMEIPAMVEQAVSQIRRKLP